MEEDSAVQDFLDILEEHRKNCENEGKYVEAEDIVEQVRLMNRTRQIVIHCISIGRRSTLLSDIAKQSGGTYKEVR